MPPAISVQPSAISPKVREEIRRAWLRLAADITRDLDRHADTMNAAGVQTMSDIRQRALDRAASYLCQ
jgi:hypothetical protein